LQFSNSAPNAFFCIQSRRVPPVGLVASIDVRLVDCLTIHAVLAVSLLLCVSKYWHQIVGARTTSGKDVSGGEGRP